MNSDAELAEILLALRVLTSRLESVLNSGEASRAATERPVFDPDVETPGVPPKVDGDEAQRNWCALMLWAQLQAVNVREGRGATKDEVVAIAKRAGYADGRGWNRWTGWDGLDERWVTEEGLAHLRAYYRKVGRTMPEDLDRVAAR